MNPSQLPVPESDDLTPTPVPASAVIKSDASALSIATAANDVTPRQAAREATIGQLAAVQANLATSARVQAVLAELGKFSA